MTSQLITQAIPVSMGEFHHCKVARVAKMSRAPTIVGIVKVMMKAARANCRLFTSSAKCWPMRPVAKARNINPPSASRDIGTCFNHPCCNICALSIVRDVVILLRRDSYSKLYSNPGGFSK